MTTLCLSLIMKNETNIIERLLESVKKIVDIICVCDTGSSDDSINKVIEFTKKNNIKCLIYFKKFVNFEVNRNYLLQKSKGLSDYILLLDADMELKHNIDKNYLTKDFYYILQETNDIRYQNIRIIKNNKDFYYKYVTHESLFSDYENLTYEILKEEKMFINDLGDGGCKENKLIRDRDLILNEFQKGNANSRYLFYLANTYFSMNEFENCIKYYKLNILYNEWNQEIWYSYYRLALSYLFLGNHKLFIENMLEAYNIIPDRIENLYYLVRYYRCWKKNNIAKIYLKIAFDILDKKINYTSYLFIEQKIYNFYIFEEAKHL